MGSGISGFGFKGFGAQGKAEKIPPMVVVRVWRPGHDCTRAKPAPPGRGHGRPLFDLRTLHTSHPLRGQI